jgi:antitoxin (DNA-binding transcriptional repressor) of toxin-antitoxin stability system
MAELGIRELRGDLAARIRRAAIGESTVITVNGRPAAQLGPLVEASAGPDRGLAALVSSGAVVPPRRADRDVPARTVAVWGTVRLDRLLREIRG